MKENNNLAVKLNKEKEILDKLSLYLDTLYINKKENNKNINIITEKNNHLKEEINKVINKYLNITNIYLKILSILFIITSIITVGFLCNLNFIIMLLFSIASPIICIFTKVYITNLLKEKYKKKNKQIIYLNTLINDNNIKLDQLKKEAFSLTNNIKETSNIYYKQEKKVNLIENIIARRNNYHQNLKQNNNTTINKYHKKIKTRK